jgi:hypothetical protein
MGVSRNDDGDEDIMPSEHTKNSFVTLYPGKEHVLHAKLQPILTYGMFSTRGLTSQEIAQKQAEQPKTWKWHDVGGMQDGEVYQVEVSKEVGVRSWMQGSVEALVEMKRAGLMPEFRRQVVPFVMVESAQFEMKRPDTDGSLNWP